MSGLLEIDHLATQLPVEGRLQTVLHDVSLTIDEGEAVGLVGESGSGKSMTARAVARLLPSGAVSSGDIRYRGRVVTDLRGGALREYRGEVAMIFQDPRTHINPVRSIGDFMTEALRTNRGVDRSKARAQAVAALDDVGIPDGERRLKQFPHELSGGLLQRVMIASALLTEPRLVLADEPTTALDVTTQAEVMAILDELRRSHGMALLFITHDLDLAGAVCDRTCVMYAGEIVEAQRSSTLGHRSAAPVHGVAVGRASRDRRKRPSSGGDPGPAGVGVRSACGLLVRAALRLRSGRLPRARPPARVARRRSSSAVCARPSCAVGSPRQPEPAHD